MDNCSQQDYKYCVLMSPFQIETIGLIAAFLTTGSFVPQLIKILKHKSTEGVSLSMYLFMFLGVSLWFLYGFLIESFSLMLANLVAGFLQLIIIYFKLKWR